MADIVALAYCSRPVRFSFEQTDRILEVSRRRNADAQVTGALIYDNRAYLQWLEGAADDIHEVFARISGDPRHEDVKLLAVRKLEARFFPDWSMTAALTQDQTLRGFKLVPHLSLTGFKPSGWSEADAVGFMDALSDYLNRRPAPKSEPPPMAPAPPQALGTGAVAALERQLRNLA